MTFTIQEKDMTLDRLTSLIKEQAQRHVYVSPSVHFKGSISLHITQASFEKLNEELASYGLVLKPQSKTIFINSLTTYPASPGGARPSTAAGDSLTVMTVDEKGEPLPGATITVKSSGKSLRTHRSGWVVLPNAIAADSLFITHINRKRTSVAIPKGGGDITIQLDPAPDSLGETLVVNYYSGPNRLSTGNIASVSGLALHDAPVSNPLLALSGRMNGLLVTQTSGVPGAGVHLQVRGPLSIASGTDPFILIDRVPFTPNNTPINNILTGTSSGSLSPFSLINPADIESIELLKDADATAIYGSRGANGVLLITTSRAHRNDPSWGLQAGSGVMHVTRVTSLLNTKDYVAMRREAFANDGYAPDANSGPDLTVWDTTRYTNFPKLLTGNTAYTSNLDFSLSKADGIWDYHAGAHYLHETNVFPGKLPNDQVSALGNVQHHSTDGKLDLQLSGMFSKDWNNQYQVDLTSLQILAPNTPALLDEQGHPVFDPGGVSIFNPYAFMLEPYKAVSSNILFNGYLHYALTPHWAFRVNTGFNQILLDENSRQPIAAQDPSSSPTGSSYYSGTSYRGWIAEPQAERYDTLGKLGINVLVGGSLQQQHEVVNNLAATGYTNDAEIGQPSAAATLTASDAITDYHYAAAYGRVHFNWDNTYILNLTARRDGSSRFGSGKQFGNFGAIGAAWIFTKLNFFQDHLGFLSYGKLRGSDGVTGNDQLGDYKYRTIWSNAAPYQGIIGFYPTNVANPNLAWEKVMKRELALELGFLRDRLYLTTVYYNNRSSNLLAMFLLPFQTGFGTELKNSEAVAEERGWEFDLQTTWVDTKKVGLVVKVNASIPRNRLLSFMNLPNTQSADFLAVGQSLNVYKGYRLLGVDPDSGIYRFASKSGTPGSSDRTALGNFDAHVYGGISSNLRIGRMQLDVFIEVRNQTGQNYQTQLENANPPGMWNSSLSNQTSAALNRWQHPGDHRPKQQFTTSYSTPAGQSILYYTGSNALLTDASFVRVKTVSLSWTLPDHFLQKTNCASARVFLSAENLFTFTHYQGTDPETQGLVLPPLRTVVAGLQMNFK